MSGLFGLSSLSGLVVLVGPVALVGLDFMVLVFKQARKTR